MLYKKILTGISFLTIGLILFTVGNLAFADEVKNTAEAETPSEFTEGEYETCSLTDTEIEDVFNYFDLQDVHLEAISSLEYVPPQVEVLYNNLLASKSKKKVDGDSFGERLRRRIGDIFGPLRRLIGGLPGNVKRSSRIPTFEFMCPPPYFPVNYDLVSSPPEPDMGDGLNYVNSMKDQDTHTVETFNLAQASNSVINNLGPCECINELTFFGHGREGTGSLQEVGTDIISPKTLNPRNPNNVLQPLLNLKPKMCPYGTINLGGCQAAKGAMMQQLANLMDKPVRGSTGNNTPGNIGGIFSPPTTVSPQ
jgi:hypothetical protein